MLTRFGRSVNVIRSYTLISSPLTSTFFNDAPSAYISSSKSFLSKQNQYRQLTYPSNIHASLDHVPYALRAAGQHFREQVRLKEITFLKENYLHLRQLLLAWDHGSDVKLLQQILPSPNEIFRDAMILLSTSPLQEHAVLHISLFNDITSVFRVPRALDPPLQFTANILEQHLTTADLGIISNIFDHFCYLREGYSDGSEAFDIRRVETWMYRLVKAANKGHADLLTAWIQKVHRSFGIQPRVYQRYIIKAYLVADLPADAWNWLVQTRSLSVKRPLPETSSSSWLFRLKASFGSNSLSSPLEPFPSHMALWNKPETEDYDMFLSYFSKRGELDAARLIMGQMHEELGDTVPTSRSWHLLLTCVLVQPGCNSSVVHEVLVNMEQHGILFSLDFLRIVSGRGQVNTWIPDHILHILRSKADSSRAASPSFSQLPSDPLCVDILPEVAPTKHAPLPQNVPHALCPVPGEPFVGDLVSPTRDGSSEVLKEGNMQSDESMMILKQIISDSHLDNPFSALNSHHEVHNDIMTAISEKDLSRALTLYESLPQLKVNFSVAYGLISLLCSPAQPSMSHISKAVGIYNDLLHAHDAHCKTSLDANRTSEINRQAEYSKIFHILIPSLTRPPNQFSGHIGLGNEHGALQIIDNLILSIKARSIRLSLDLIAPIVLCKFRSAVNHKEAFNSYMSLMSDVSAVYSLVQEFWVDKPILVPPKDCHNILSAFAHLSFPAWPVAPASLWLPLLSDLNSRGYRTAGHDYCIYLKAISDWKRTKMKSTWKIMGQESNEVKISRRMIQSARAIHRHVLVDPYINPSPHLFNALINTYQYLGEFDRALEIFNTSWILRRFDAATTSIMFDACGNASQGTVASLIWSMLVGKGWKFNKATLDAWIECLCRLGYVSLACNFVCHFMGRENSGYMAVGDTRPDERTCLIVLKLAWTVGQNLEVKEKIKTHLPDIWRSLKVRSGM